MRMMLKVKMPVEAGNEAIKSGALAQTMQSMMEAFKPEAAYFYPEDGLRAALFVFEMDGSSDIPSIAEPMFMNLGAAIELTPVMNADDLQKGLQQAGY